MRTTISNPQEPVTTKVLKVGDATSPMVIGSWVVF